MILVMYAPDTNSILWFKPWRPDELFTEEDAENGRLGWSTLEAAMAYGWEVIGEL